MISLAILLILVHYNWDWKIMSRHHIYCFWYSSYPTWNEVIRKTFSRWYSFHKLMLRNSPHHFASSNLPLSRKTFQSQKNQPMHVQFECFYFHKIKSYFWNHSKTDPDVYQQTTISIEELTNLLMIKTNYELISIT